MNDTAKLWTLSTLNNEQIPLKGLDIRGRVHDLELELVIRQTFKNLKIS